MNLQATGERVAIVNQDVNAYEAMSEEFYLVEQARRFDRTIDILRRENARTPWIEFGALAGGFAERCADALQLARSEMCCCDFTPAFLNRAASRGFSTCAWDLEQQPRPASLAPGSFNTVLFCEIIEHLVAPDRTLGKVVELLAPGGLLLVTTPNLASLGNRLRLLRGKTPSLAPAPGAATKAPGSLAATDHLRVCVVDEWVHLIQSLGLQVVRVEGATSAPHGWSKSLRRNLSVAMNLLLERVPGKLWHTTAIVARKP